MGAFGAITILLGLALAAIDPVAAQGVPSPESEVLEWEGILRNDTRVDPDAEFDELLTELASVGGKGDAEAIEKRIAELWMDSGSDAINLLMAWSVRAIEEKDYEVALDLLDRIVALEPEFAEGWNKRATVHFLMNDVKGSIADLERALELEPRHFDALARLGIVLRAAGDDGGAADALKRALELDPHLKDAQNALDAVSGKRDGI